MAREGEDARLVLKLLRLEDDVQQVTEVTAVPITSSSAALVVPNGGGESFPSSDSGGAPAKLAGALVHGLRKIKITRVRKGVVEIIDKVIQAPVIRGDGGAHLFELGNGGRRRKFDLEFEIDLGLNLKIYLGFRWRPGWNIYGRSFVGRGQEIGANRKIFLSWFGTGTVSCSSWNPPRAGR